MKIEDCIWLHAPGYDKPTMIYDDKIPEVGSIREVVLPLSLFQFDGVLHLMWRTPYSYLNGFDDKPSELLEHQVVTGNIKFSRQINKNELGETWLRRPNNLSYDSVWGVYKFSIDSVTPLLLYEEKDFAPIDMDYSIEIFESYHSLSYLYFENYIFISADAGDQDNSPDTFLIEKSDDIYSFIYMEKCSGHNEGNILLKKELDSNEVQRLHRYIESAVVIDEYVEPL